MHLFLVSLLIASTLSFTPDHSQSPISPNFPLVQNISTFQTSYSEWPGTSWWLNAYITTTCNKRFFLVSHAIFRAGGGGRLRSSVLSLDHPRGEGAYENNLIVVERPKDGSVIGEGTGRLRIGDGEEERYVFEALSDDNLDMMRTMARNNDNGGDWGFDLSWKTTSPILLNWGGNAFDFGDGKTIEWSLPANRVVNGSAVVFDGQKMEIDAEESSVWYDRQVNDGYPKGGWTWFALQFPGSDIKLTVFDYRGEDKRFASVRTRDGMVLMGDVEIVVNGSKDWRSDFSGLAYRQAWNIQFGNGDWLAIWSVREDQEIRGSATEAALNIWEGFVMGMGQFMGQKEAFGLVEQFHTS